MYEKKIPARLDCGLHLFKELLNGKWKLMLIYYISAGFKRPGELQRKIANADRRVLNNQLHELVHHGFINKAIFDSKVPKVEYELTDLGERPASNYPNPGSMGRRSSNSIGKCPDTVINLAY